MAFFRLYWLKKMIRTHSKPIEENRALIWRKRLSVAYMLISWNALALVGYMMYSGKTDWAAYYGLKSDEELKLSPGQVVVKKLGLNSNTEIYKVSGFQIEKVPSLEEHEKTTSQQIN